ncbi:peptide ligase PGM1-related protein [Geodermatophilus marinus]|uniref:peptide ligase PGM1-related protein n=1 Tax=Geodermatophilus sp. LHW52908 TaxID=2303986 RepID=UPI0011C11E59|nr:peptide ligase PGM1-related protein [Geodermatophilus sp. LHW52908]
MRDFAELQQRLETACAVDKPGSRVPHVLIALPSFSLGESLLSHYVDRIPALEHRYLVAALVLPRIPGAELVFTSSQPPDDAVVDHYLSLVPPAERASVRRRLRVLVVPDRSGRSIAAKLLDRPDLLAGLRGWIGDRPAFIEPWNVTADEVQVARWLDAPINGTAPELWPLGFKSAGRRLLRGSGVPVPFGCEDVRSVEDVDRAAGEVLRRRPGAAGVVVKLDDSGAGDGNVVLRCDGLPGAAGRLRDAARRLPGWFLAALRSGGVVEEFVTGDRFASPSVQGDISPDGSVTVLATHEQVLGGDSGQVYLGCTFPADSGYAAELGRYGSAAGEALARCGARGRYGVDFVASATGDRWHVQALEINLRKGGTTHPYAVLRNLVPGRYDVEGGRWVAEDGEIRAYSSTDNLVDPDWTGLDPRRVVDAVTAAGLRFDRGTRTGVVLHMLSGLAIDGRCGLTAIATSTAAALEMVERTRACIDEAARRPAGAGRAAEG